MIGIPRATHCEHCFQRQHGGFVPEISGPYMTRYRYNCRFCGESVYLGYEFDADGNPVHEAPGRGHLYESSTPDGVCEICHRPPGEAADA